MSQSRPECRQPRGLPSVSQLLGALNRLRFFQCKVTHAFDSPGRNRVYVKQKFSAHRAAEGKGSWSVLSLLLFTCPSSQSLPSSLFRTVVMIKVVSEWAAGRVTLNERVPGAQMWSAGRGQTSLFTRDTLEPVIGTAVVIMFFSFPSEKVVVPTF